MAQRTPEQLRKAAEFAEDAEQAEQAASAVERAASNARHEANAKRAAAQSADGEVQVDHQAPRTRVLAGEASETKRGASTVVALVIAGVALLVALIAGGVVLWKNSDHQVTQANITGHSKLINEHSSAIGELKGRADANEKATVRAQGTADQALTTANQAASAASACNTCCKQCATAKPAKPKGEQKKAVCTGCVPRETLTITSEKPRIDGKCITVLNTGSRVQITEDGTSNRLIARLVGADAKPAGGPVVYVGRETVSGSCHTDEKKLISHWEEVRKGLKLPTHCRPA